MCAVRRGTAVTADAHGAGATGEHALNGKLSPVADAVAVFFEVAVPAVIDGEEKLGGAGYIHETEYKAERRSCKLPKLRSSAAHAAGVLRSLTLREALAMVRALNKMTKAGMPESVRIA